MKSLREEIRRKSILQLWIFETDERDKSLLTKDIIKVPFVPYIFIGKILSEKTITLTDRNEVKGHLLVLHGRERT